MMTMNFINGVDNPADILSKAWAYAKVWPLLQAVLFWKGDTMELYRPDAKDGE